MPQPNDRPFRFTDGEKAAPEPPVVPAQKLPIPNLVGYNGTEHSETIPWPAAQEDPTKPYKSLR